MFGFGEEAGGTTSWLDDINALATGVAKAATTIGAVRNSNAMNAIQVNAAQQQAAAAAAAGPITAATLFSGTGFTGNLAQYIKTPQGRAVALVVGAVAAYLIWKHVS